MHVCRLHVQMIVVRITWRQRRKNSSVHFYVIMVSYCYLYQMYTIMCSSYYSRSIDVIVGYLVFRGHVILSLGVLAEDLVTETALNLGGLTSMLGLYVGIQARLGKLLVTSNAEVGIFGLFLALIDFHVGQLSRSFRCWRSCCCFCGSSSCWSSIRSWGWRRSFRIEAVSSYDDGRAILVFVNPKDSRSGSSSSFVICALLLQW